LRRAVKNFFLVLRQKNGTAVSCPAQKPRGSQTVSVESAGFCAWTHERAAAFFWAAFVLTKRRSSRQKSVNIFSQKIPQPISWPQTPTKKQEPVCLAQNCWIGGKFFCKSKKKTRPQSKDF
jgi:hypothetical protein